MTAEQEFFEAFGIEPSKHFFCGKHLPRYKCVCWDRARQRNSYCKDWDYKNKKCEFYTEDIERRYYPPITPEIVLGLVKLALDNGWKFTQYKTGEYVIERNSHEYCVIDKSFDDAILILFIELKKYPKSFNEIQAKVRELFK